jgi:anti-sigma regulatory factor (Ser/Thr protein kinase)
VSVRHPEILRLRLRCDVSAPRLARKALERLTEIIPVREDALLVASELTSNAVLHSGAAPNGQIELCAKLVPEGLRIEVIDEGRSGDTPHTRESDIALPGGFGLPVVEAVSHRWGSERLRGMRVWAELAL